MEKIKDIIRKKLAEMSATGMGGATAVGGDGIGISSKYFIKKNKNLKEGPGATLGMGPSAGSEPLSNWSLRNGAVCLKYGLLSDIAKKNGKPPIATSYASAVFCHTADEDTIPKSTAIALLERPSVISRPATVLLN